ncbi:Serine/threonine-protein kinase [Meloidogyne graminicola]|uniref:Serine/threonine-protein kinase n=1 Tax=Meloidogyne graminicola TaxID=189291 RepID=A0A8S9ZS63_9BILA|nr:Serine/threonine-protein kinase [Meloidogyne graminicola]
MSNHALNIGTGLTLQTRCFTYTLGETIGGGDNAERIECAFKLGRISRRTKIETDVLLAAKEKNCRYIPKLLDYGEIKDMDCIYVVMENKGLDLHKLPWGREGKKFSLFTAVYTGLATLNCIEELHELGYVSRDIKSDNFVIGQTTDKRSIYIIDFELCRKYKDISGNIFAPRDSSPYRGLTVYGSINAHQNLELCRKDDIESWFYMLVELVPCSLPWSRAQSIFRLTNKKKIFLNFDIYTAKQSVLNMDTFLENCPQGYKEIIQAITKLNFGDKPPYNQIKNVLQNILVELGANNESPLDWETPDEEIVSSDD